MVIIKRIFTKEVSYYAAAILLCLLILFLVLQLWSADLNIPFSYHWDSIYMGTTIKGMIENGWTISNPMVGAPLGQNMAELPVFGNLDLIIMKTISVVSRDWAATMNLYYLLTFPLTVITSLLVLRKLKVTPVPAIVGSLLFTFIPYHFFRGENHLALSSYYLIPLVILITFWIFENDFLLSRLKQPLNGNPVKSSTGKNLAAVLICVGIGATFIYYPFFSCFFLLVSGVMASILLKKWQPMANALTLTGIVTLCVVVCNIPGLLYQLQNGANPLIARSPAESETWGLKIIELLLPVEGHRITMFADLSKVYSRYFPLVNENKFAALGIIGGLGFLILIAWAFFRLVGMPQMKQNVTFQKLNQLGILNLAAILLGTLGGFGVVVNSLIQTFSRIRCYNRVSIYIAFFAILAVVLLIDFVKNKYSASKIKGGIIYVGLIIILFFGIFDQTSARFIPDYKENRELYSNDANYVSNIEGIIPENGMVFQLPYVSFPETPVNDMESYDHFRTYLHSTKIRWSFGAVKGRDESYWQTVLTTKPVEEMVEGLSFIGFNGIYVDIKGYEDGGEEIIASLTSILNETPIIDGNERLYFFDMTDYNTDLKSQYTAQEIEEQRQNILYPSNNQ